MSNNTAASRKKSPSISETLRVFLFMQATFSYRIRTVACFVPYSSSRCKALLTLRLYSILDAVDGTLGVSAVKKYYPSHRLKPAGYSGPRGSPPCFLNRPSREHIKFNSLPAPAPRDLASMTEPICACGTTRPPNLWTTEMKRARKSR